MPTLPSGRDDPDIPCLGDRHGVVIAASLLHFKWTVPILAALSATDGATVAQLASRFETNRASVRRALGPLVRARWVLVRTGHHHPLSPEVALTGRVTWIAARCFELEAEVNRLGIVDVARRKWGLPILGSLPRNGRRFSELRNISRDITDRALSLALDLLKDHDLIARQVTGFDPPMMGYVAVRGGVVLQKSLGALVGAVRTSRAQVPHA